MGNEEFDHTKPFSFAKVFADPKNAAVLGIMFAPRSLRRSLAPTFLAAALIALFHTLTIVSARFHIPIEPLMAIWAAAPLGRERFNRV